MKHYLTLIFVLGLHTQVQAGTEANQTVLRERAVRESTWKPIDLAIPGLKGEIKGVRTDDGQVKLDYLDGVIESQTALVSKVFERYSGKAQYLKDCKANINVFPSLRAIKIPYQLNMPILGPNPVNGFTTKMPSIEFFKVQVAATPGALVFQSGDLDITKLEKDIQFQLEKNQKDIESTGRITLDLSGLDDVACDLVAGDLTLNVQTRIHYSAPRLHRTPRLSEQDVRALFEHVQHGWAPGTQAQRNLVLGSVRLGQAMENRAGNALALEDWEIVRLHGQFFEPTNFTLISLSVADYPRVATEMDWFDERSTYSTPVYHTAVISPFSGN